MNKYKVIFSFLVTLLGGYSDVAISATTYKWPVISSVDVLYTSPTESTYTVHFDWISIPDSSALNTPPDVCMRETCNIRFVHRHYDIVTTNSGGLPGVTTDYVKYPKNTWRDILELTSTWSFSNTKTGHTGSQGGECIDLSVTSRSGGASDIDWDSYTANARKPPGVGTGCFGLPPVNQWCALTTPSISFDFGTIKLEDAVGTRKKQNVNVECTVGMKYVLKLKGLTDMSLDNGMTAEFTANGKKLGESLDGVAGKVNPVELEATLAGTPPADGGDFSGTSVLAVSYP